MTVGLMAAPLTAIGTVTTIDVAPTGAPAEIEQVAPKLVSPTVVGQVSVTPGVAGVTTIETGPLIVMPAGKASVNTIGATVGVTPTAILIL